MLGGIVESLEEIARTAVTAPPAANFQGLEFLVGGVWVNTASGSTTCEALQFTLSARFISSIQTSYSNNKAVLTTGLLGLDPSGKLIMWAFTSSGSYISMTQVPPTPGPRPGPAATWTLEGMVQQTKIRQSLHKVGADAMQTVTSKFVQGGGWQALPPVPYQRS